MASRRPTRLLVMSEVGVDVPVWDRSDGPTGSLDLAELGVSAALIERLQRWNSEHPATGHSPDRPRAFPKNEYERWRRTGQRLAAQLQDELRDIEVTTSF